MNEIYYKALKIARNKVFDDDKYTEIIEFCKYKLDPNVYTRNEYIKQFRNGKEIKTKVFITTEKANNFTEYKQKQTNKTNIKTEIIF